MGKQCIKRINIHNLLLKDKDLTYFLQHKAPEPFSNISFRGMTYYNTQSILFNELVHG